MARMREASAQIGPIVMFGLPDALQVLRAGRGNGIHLVPPVTAPRHEAPGEGFLVKTSASTFCF